MNALHTSLERRSIAAALGGDVAEPRSILAPGPNS
jgi:hypothetical protein